ncbi:MAG: cbb3-type cytochrome c oxidase N-terminal domain-containing protein [Bacteroidota bacterium]
MNNLNFKRITIGLVLLSFGTAVWAKKVGENAIDPDYMTDMLGKLVLATGFTVALFVMAYLFRLLFMILNIHKMRLLKEQGIEVPEVVETAPQESWWSWLYKKATQVVPVEKEADIMLDHNYDGIQELDNRLPPWWVAMFYITIAIGTVYFAYYHYLDMGDSSQEWYAKEMAYAEEIKARFLEKQANLVNESNVAILTDEAALANGVNIYQSNCSACHGQLGEGGIGPNLTDAYWLHGGDIKSIFKTIKYGVPEKGMIAWKAQLRPSDIHQVASYITTLVGTNPPNAKEPQGMLDEQSPTQEAAQDSTTNSAIGMK